MAFQPSPRPAGSDHILRFQGSLRVGTSTDNASVQGGVPIANNYAVVNFWLRDLTDPTDTTKQLPAYVYDDSVPADGAPHNPAGGPSGADGFSDPAGRTWMQNVRVRVGAMSSTTASPLIAAVRELTPVCGLSISRGPLVQIEIAFTAAGVAALSGGTEAVGVPAVVEIEIPHTIQR